MASRPGAQKVDAPIPIDAALVLLKRQADLMIEMCGAAARDFQQPTDKPHATEAVQYIAVSSSLWLAHEMLEGLSLCLHRRLAAPAHALARATWESLLNANLHLLRAPEEAMGALKFEADRVRAAVANARSWEKSRDEKLGVRQKLEIVRASSGRGSVYHQLDRSRKHLYSEASHRIHGDMYGALSNATLAGTGLDGEWSREHELEPIVIWLMIALDATIGAFARKYAPGFDAPKESRAFLDALIAMLPKATADGIT